MHLKQVALVASELDPVRQMIFDLLGLTDDFADPGLVEFGLRNSVMTIGDTFLEVVSPNQPDTTAGRLLDRRGGDGGYMVLAQTKDLKAVSARIEALGIRKVWQVEREEVSAFHVHPRDIGAAIVSFDEMRPFDEWVWAGPGWRDRSARFVAGISGVDIQAIEPEQIANRWGEAFNCEIREAGTKLVLQLENGVVNFEAATDGRGDGVCGLQFEVLDGTAIKAAAASHNLPWQGNELQVCGTRFRFQDI